MKTLLLLLIGFAVTLNAYTYNSQLMQVYAKIAPRLVLMTQNPQKDLQAAITIIILYERGDEESSEQLRAAMLQNYPNGLKERPLDIRMIPYDAALHATQSSLLFLLDTDADTLKPVLAFARAQQIPTMSYNSRFLQDGVMLSLHLGKTVRPYLNLESAAKSRITVDNLLLQISKIYTPERDK